MVHKPEYLHTVSGVYYFRRRVPKDLRELVGKEFFKDTLETRDLFEAKIRLRRAASENDALIEKLRANKPQSQQPPRMYLADDGSLMLDYQNPFAPKPYGKTVEQLLPEILSAKTYSQASIDGLKLATRRFREVCGEIDVTLIKRSHAELYRNTLQRLPTYPPHKVRSMVAPDQADWADVQGSKRLSLKRVNDGLMWIKLILDYAYNKTAAFEGRDWTNPFIGFITKVKETETEDRRPFSNSQLKIVFGPDHYSQQCSNAAFFWIPLILLFTGARLNEIAVSAAVDVVDDEVPYLDLLSRDNGRTAKTLAGYRLVPIHQTLIDLGLMEYAEMMRSTGEKHLFPTLPHHRGRHRADKLSEGFISSFRNYGKANPQTKLNTPLLTTHSLRHSFETNALTDGVAPEMLDIFLGHTPVGEGRKSYAKTLRENPTAMKRNVLDHMRFPDVSWMKKMAAEILETTKSRSD